MDVEQLAELLRRGQVVAYPCEGVWGLGCDPQDGQAVNRLLSLKGRNPGQGLILIASQADQIAPYLRDRTDDGTLNTAWQQARQFWPGPVTCLLPSAADCPDWLCGDHAGTLAIRISAHPPVRELCQAFGGALVSTSANPSGQPPARCSRQVRAYFGDHLPMLDNADVGTLQGPTPILDPIGNRWLRGGASAAVS